MKYKNNNDISVRLGPLYGPQPRRRGRRGRAVRRADRRDRDPRQGQEEEGEEEEKVEIFSNGLRFEGNKHKCVKEFLLYIV